MKPADKKQIHCTAQQSRFHVDTLDSSHEVDLHDVTISVGAGKIERVLLQDAHVRIKNGTKYALVGRNGTGKSTLLEALNNKMIPGLNSKLKICLLSQIDQLEDVIDSTATVLEHVIKGDKAALKAEQRFLNRAVESTDIRETQEILLKLSLEEKEEQLDAARMIAQRRSGARGKAARLSELEAEAKVAEAKQELREAPDASEAPVLAAQKLQDAQAEFELLNGPTREARARSILRGLGFSTAQIDAPVKHLSGGWKSRSSLAIALLIESDILLLDECTNFLDLDAILWLEGYLSEQTRTVVLVSHDQEFLSNIVDETIVLRDASLRYFEGNPAAFQLEERKKYRAALKTRDALDRKREHIEKSIQQAASSARKTGDENKQRMAKSRQRKLDERFGVETSAKGTRFKVNRDMAGYHLSRRAAVEIEAPEKSVTIKLGTPSNLRAAGNLIALDGVSFARKGRAQLENISLTLSPKGRIAILGPNGAGKTTLARLMVGELLPTKGAITRHSQARIAYFAQESVEQLSTDAGLKTDTGEAMTALAYLGMRAKEQGDELTEAEARACLSAVGLQGKVASDTPLAVLSGGQKVRLALALIFYHPPHALILDEPSTHLDFATVLALAQALRHYQGGICLITHDRWLSRVVVEGESVKTATAGLAGAEDEDDDGESSSEEDEASEQGVTYRLHKGQLQVVAGVDAYVRQVEKALKRRPAPAQSR
ncbi:hypothetical protein OIV83_004118 [Microbotryomycetes sp. JL201]|nr:hypothetical protein OIV83_004118 [Microbotryomycetes sp. JL201]